MTVAQMSPTTLSIEHAERAIDAAKKKAAEIGLPFTVTVVGAGIPCFSSEEAASPLT